LSFSVTGRLSSQLDLPLINPAGNPVVGAGDAPFSIVFRPFSIYSLHSPDTYRMGGNASKVGFEAIVKQLTTKEVNPTDYEVSSNHSSDDVLIICDYGEDCKTSGKN
jgi:hypothetical protein